MADVSPSVEERVVLPLLPLSTGVVLPQMVVTLALESDEARQAADAAAEGEGLVLLVPRVEGRYARVGTIARVESAGDLPTGVRALVLRGLARAVVGVGVPGRGSGLWVEAEPVAEAGDPTPRTRELATEYRALVSEIATRLRCRAPLGGAAGRERAGCAGRHGRLVAGPVDRAQGRRCSRPSTSRRASRRSSAGHVRRSPSSRWPTRSAPT